MTKDQEVKLLHDTIDRFGAHSYIGPWLSAYRLALEADIRSDFPPSAPMPADARAEAAAILAEAHKERDRILAEAAAKAEAIVTQARGDLETMRARVRSHVKKTLDTLDYTLY